ncbi:hypothetical protein ACFOW6_10440 [Fodinicurvata halophila]|uniref:Methylamine utilization protein MauE n=1 Tax=Fodinicurvata halophila TaxID=1419723 RepID=A0ABV8UM28_9PROT
MSEVSRQLMEDSRARLILGATTLVYLLLYLVALGDLAFDGTLRALDGWLVPRADELWTQARVPFQFEAIGVVELPFAIWLVSPLNLLIGLALGALAGLQLALTRIALLCTRSCGIRPPVGLLAALPALLAGHACCVPALFMLLGLQVTATMITLVSIMIPLAFLLLAIGVGVTWRYAHRRCREAYA